MTKPATRLALAVCLAALLLAGCAASSPPVAYYSLYAPARQPAKTATLTGGALTLSIGPVTIPDILKQTKIATGGGDGRYRLAEYHRWSGELDRDFARAVAEQLAVRLGTEQVAIFPWDQQLSPTWRVLIDVLSMGGEPGKEATLEVRWMLVDPIGKLSPLTRRSDLCEAPAEPGYAGWVVAQQRNIARLGAEISAAVEGVSKP